MGADEGYFGERVAAVYDEHSAGMFDPAVVGPAVEMLAERGPRVVGIDSSEAMLARLREKPGAERIEAMVGDMAATRVDGEFSLVYLVFNTIFNLTTQDGQVACFENAAAHLEPGGCFVVEVGVPGLRSLPPGATLRAFDVSDTHVGVDEYDVANQGLVSHHLTLVEGEWVRLSIPFRSVWPSELDLMARIAGMRPRERWSDWKREPFTSESTRHVSVWEKA